MSSESDSLLPDLPCGESVPSGAGQAVSTGLDASTTTSDISSVSVAPEGFSSNPFVPSDWQAAYQLGLDTGLRQCVEHMEDASQFMASMGSAIMAPTYEMGQHAEDLQSRIHGHSLSLIADLEAAADKAHGKVLNHVFNAIAEIQQMASTLEYQLEANQSSTISETEGSNVTGANAGTQSPSVSNQLYPTQTGYAGMGPPEIPLYPSGVGGTSGVALQPNQLGGGTGPAEPANLQGSGTTREFGPGNQPGNLPQNRVDHPPPQYQLQGGGYVCIQPNGYPVVVNVQCISDTLLQQLLQLMQQIYICLCTDTSPKRKKPDGTMENTVPVVELEDKIPVIRPAFKSPFGDYLVAMPETIFDTVEDGAIESEGSSSGETTDSGSGTSP